VTCSAAFQNEGNPSVAGVINLWNPTHTTFALDLLTAFALGALHGITPDEHTWPITFSYAVGGYSTRRGLCAGLSFSLAFTAQRALASELAWLGLSRWFTFSPLDAVVDIGVGLAMVAAGLFVSGRGVLPHFRVGALMTRNITRPAPREPRAWMPAAHGFIAGWGFGAFAAIIYAVLAPAMPSAATGWLPGFAFGLGTLVMQASAGAAFGTWLARRHLPAETIRQIGLLTATRTLFWGGWGFVALGVIGVAFPGIAAFAIVTPLHVHNLHELGLPFVVLLFTVLGVGAITLATSIREWRSNADAPHERR
jgi:sulfite exporter TauE/SafE